MAIFEFKKFDLEIDKNVFPITTDAVLLASWVEINSSDLVLEVGIGSGIISFICKFKFSNIEIHGIDINSHAIKTAEFNMDNLGLDGMTFSSISFQEFESKTRYDHIICNPPYFANSLLPLSQKMKEAKHRENFDFGKFASFCNRNIKDNGSISVILPYDQENELSYNLCKFGFSPSRICKIKHCDNSNIKFVLLEYQKPYRKLKIETQALYTQDSNIVSNWHADLIKEVLK